MNLNTILSKGEEKKRRNLCKSKLKGEWEESKSKAYTMNTNRWIDNNKKEKKERKAMLRRRHEGGC